MKVCINITKNNNSSLGLGLGTAVNLVILKYNEQQANTKLSLKTAFSRTKNICDSQNHVCRPRTFIGNKHERNMILYS